MLADHTIELSLPASDIARAKAFYQDKLGLKPTQELPDGAAFYESGEARFLLYPSPSAGTNQATAGGWAVSSVPDTVAELRSNGVVFEEYDLDELKTEDGIATTEEGLRAAWFKDSEGNILGVFEEPA